jgi:predicted patatin/cPLA2 family phospholipase
VSYPVTDAFVVADDFGPDFIVVIPTMPTDTRQRDAWGNLCARWLAKLRQMRDAAPSGAA